MTRDLSKSLTKAERLRMTEQHATQQAELIEEIAEAAEKIAAARSMTGDPVFRTDPVWALLKTVERAPYCCSFSDLGRLMKISRQHARRVAFRPQPAAS